MPPEDTPTVSAWAVEHARELTQGGERPSRGRVEVELLTDPWSVWCWGFEPARRALAHRFPTVAFSARVGGMFPTMPDPEQMGFDVERFFSIVQRTTGMPIRLDATRADRPKSTYPACVHAAAVRLLQPELEPLYLRRLREAVYLDGRNVSRPEVAADVAGAIGIDETDFMDALNSGEPEREFRQALALLEAENMHAYPTFTIRTHERAARVEGFQSLPSLLALVEGMSGRLHPPMPPPRVEDVLRPDQRIATREVAETCGMSVEEAFEALTDLARRGVADRERHASGDVWTRAD